MNQKFVFLLFSLSFLYAENLPVFQEIKDIYHPSYEDLKKIQEALFQEERPILKRLGDKEEILRNFKIIGDAQEEQPVVLERDLNTTAEDKENCVICYSSFNENYPKGCKRLFLHLILSDFKGHVKCQIGGWPYLEGGSLPLISVPFSFKVCFLKEMQQKGYQKVLWMDASILPLVSLNKIFKIIEQKGYFIQENSHTLCSPYMNPELEKIFGISIQETEQLYCCSAAILGFDFRNERVCQLVDAWYEAAKDPIAFYSPRSDQTALSLLLYQFQMTDWMPGSILGSPKDIKNCLFKMEREYVKCD